MDSDHVGWHYKSQSASTLPQKKNENGEREREKISEKEVEKRRFIVFKLGNICERKANLQTRLRKKNEEWDKIRDCQNLKAFLMFYDVESRRHNSFLVLENIYL